VRILLLSWVTGKLLLRVIVGKYRVVLSDVERDAGTTRGNSTRLAVDASLS